MRSVKVRKAKTLRPESENESGKWEIPESGNGLLLSHQLGESAECQFERRPWTGSGRIDVRYSLAVSVSSVVCAVWLQASSPHVLVCV